MRARDFRRRYGPWALVAGASEGLGAEFARQVASRRVNVLAIALEQAALDRVASEIRAAYGVEVRTAVLDLGGAGVDAALDELVTGIDIGLFVHNAAFSPIGRFVEQDLADKVRALDVNCRSPLVLAHRLARPMVDRGRGGIVLLSSMAALQGTAMVATYAATKAFSLVLA